MANVTQAPKRHRIFSAWAGVVSRRPGVVFAAAVVVALASAALSLTMLRFEPDRNALISDELNWNQRFLHWIEMFPGTNDMYVAVDTFNHQGQPSETTQAQAEQLVHELGAALAADANVEAAVWGFPRDSANPKTLRLEDEAYFDAQLTAIQDAKLLLASPTLADFLQRMSAKMQTQLGGAQDAAIPPDQIKMFAGLLDAIHERLTTDPQQRVDFFEATVDTGRGVWQYMTTTNDRVLLIRVTPKREAESLAPFDTAIQSIRAVIDVYREQYPSLEFGLTGIDVLESDETVAVQRDSTFATIIAAILIAVLLMMGFHSVRLPVAMMVSLGIAIAWAFGFTTLAIGHLQVISVVFAMILLGLGVAYAIHLASRYEQVRHHYDDDDAGMAAALRDTFVTMGPGVLTGAITTAAAFGTTLFTDFLGVAEMGLIAAVGVLLCVVAMFTAFAALLCLVKKSHRHTVAMKDRWIHFYEDRWVMPFANHPWRTLAGAAVVFAGSLWAVQHMRFDYNLLALMPPDLPSIRWQQKIGRDGQQSIYTAVSVTDSIEEAAVLAEKFLALPTVDSVAGIGNLLTPNEEARLTRIGAMRESLEQVEKIESNAQPLLLQLGGLQLALPVYAMNRPELAPINTSLARVMQTARSLSPAERDARLTALQVDYEVWQKDLYAYLMRVLDTSPIDVEDVSPAVLGPYFADTDDGRKYVLEVNPLVPAGIEDALDPRFLGGFVRDIESVDPNATGVIVQVYHSGSLIQRSYLKAGAMAMVIVFVLVWIDFRSLIDALAALVPVGVGFAATFGVMYLAGASINPANIIVLPLMFGIGVDDGVHIIHRYRANSRTRPLGLSDGTGKGVSLTSYTTMIGFGAMIFASHRGISSLGFVLTVGIGLTLLACWTIMPAYLELRQRYLDRRNGG